MAHVVDATYEGGVLKPDRPLPLAEQEKVRITVESLAEATGRLDAVLQTYGLIPWSGNAETLERLAMDPEFDLLESP